MTVILEYSNEFKVSYYRGKKPTGKTPYYIRADTFESVYNNFIIKDLCEKVYGHDFLFGVWDSIKHELLHKNEYQREHKLIFKDGKKILETYIVEIDLKFNGGAYNPNYESNDENSEPLTPEYEQYLHEQAQKEREAKYAKWFLNISDWEVADFLKQLEKGMNLEQIRSQMLSDDLGFQEKDEIIKVYDKILKSCQEKGYVKNALMSRAVLPDDTCAVKAEDYR